MRQIDQDAARKAAARDAPHLASLVEPVLQHLVGLQLDGAGLVHLPPQQLVALRTGDKARLGQPGHGCLDMRPGAS